MLTSSKYILYGGTYSMIVLTALSQSFSLMIPGFVTYLVQDYFTSSWLFLKPVLQTVYPQNYKNEL